MMAQDAMERKIVHVTLLDKVKNSGARYKTKIKDILEKIQEAHWRWAGHKPRREDN